MPHHRTDLILRKVNLDRYDDRDFVDVNLIESYERIMAFVHKHLPDSFLPGRHGAYQSFAMPFSVRWLLIS